MMDLARVNRAKSGIKRKEMKSVGIELNYDSIFVIKLPDSRVLRIISRSLFIAIFVLTLPSMASFVREGSSALPVSGFGSSNSISFQSLLLVFQDLLDEGLVKRGQKGLILRPDMISDLVENLQFLRDKEIEFSIDLYSKGEMPIPKEEFDFVIAPSFGGAKFVNPAIKIDGILVTQLSSSPSDEFRQPSNFKIAYIRRFCSTVVALRKISSPSDHVNDSQRRRLCGVAEDDAKNAAMDVLEDVLLEPPRKPLSKSSDYLKRIKFLPDIMGQSYESYSRRVFVTDDEEGVINWFRDHYPKKDKNFEIFHLKIKSDAEKAASASDWLRNNVRRVDYVVMKAGAEVAEVMINEKAVHLVDELFLECENQWGDTWKKRSQKKKKKRAYWECLALYGKLRDEGVAVHQWWG